MNGDKNSLPRVSISNGSVFVCEMSIPDASSWAQLYSHVELALRRPPCASVYRFRAKYLRESHFVVRASKRPGGFDVPRTCANTYRRADVC